MPWWTRCTTCGERVNAIAGLCPECGSPVDIRGMGEPEVEE